MNPQWEVAFAKEVRDITGAITQMQRTMTQSIAQYARTQASAASSGGLNHPNSGVLPTNLREKWNREARTEQAFSDATMGSRWMHSDRVGNVRVDNTIANPWADRNHQIVPGPSDGSPPPGSHGQYHKLEPGWQR